MVYSSFMDERKERSPQDIFNASRVLNNLFSGRISPAQATRAMKAGFASLGLEKEEGYGRLSDQHTLFKEVNFELTQKQMVAWDDFVICFEREFDISEEKRISRNRLVPLAN